MKRKEECGITFTRPKVEYFKFAFGLIVFLIGVGMMFLPQTKYIGPFLIGFGLVVAMRAIP